MNVKRTIGLMFLAIILGACQLLPPANVETIVNEPGMRYWELSPDGTGLVYGGSKADENFLVELSNHRKQKIDCSLDWLNDETLLCRRHNRMTVLARTLFVESDPLKKVDIKTLSNTDLSDLLARARKIFRPSKSNAGYIYILDSNSENYVITGVEDLDSILQDYTYASFPTRFGCPQEALDEKSISPDGEYYYTVIRQRQSILTIAKVADNEKLSSFTTEEAKAIVCGGWASDSSGVFFRVHGTGFNSGWASPKIQKLKVPPQ